VTIAFFPLNYLSAFVPACQRWTYLSSGLVLIERIMSFLNSSSLWLPLHVILDTDDSVNLGFNGESTRLGEFSRTTSGGSGLTVSIYLLDEGKSTYCSGAGCSRSLTVSLTSDFVFDVVDSLHFVLVLVVC